MICSLYFIYNANLIFFSDDETKNQINWLKNNFEPKARVIDYWKNTSDARKEISDNWRVFEPLKHQQLFKELVSLFFKKNQISFVSIQPINFFLYKLF